MNDYSYVHNIIIRNGICLVKGFFVICHKKTELGKTPSSVMLNFIDYSLRSATTGSFFAALREGIIPEISVKPILIATRIIAAPIGRYACKVAKPVSANKMRLIGTHNK